MKVSIIIECDTGTELVNHLQMLKIQAKKEIRKYRKNRGIFKYIFLKDNNCYGMHNAKISNVDYEDFTS